MGSNEQDGQVDSAPGEADERGRITEAVSEVLANCQVYDIGDGGDRIVDVAEIADAVADRLAAAPGEAEERAGDSCEHFPVGRGGSLVVCGQCGVPRSRWGAAPASPTGEAGDAARLWALDRDADADLPDEWLDGAEARGLIYREVDHNGNPNVGLTAAGDAVIAATLAAAPGEAREGERVAADEDAWQLLRTLLIWVKGDSATDDRNIARAIDIVERHQLVPCALDPAPAPSEED